MRSEAEIKLLTGVAVESWVTYVFQQWKHVANHYSHNSYLNTIHITTTWISWQEFNSAKYCLSTNHVEHRQCVYVITMHLGSIFERPPDLSYK